MPILNLDDEQDSLEQPKFRTQEELKTSVIFNNETPIEKITYQVDGYKWEVEYYNQILGVNSQPLDPDVNIPNTTLKYNKISHLVIYLESGLPQGNVEELTGSGIINAGFVPYKGDAFTATLAGGRIGLFVLTNVDTQYYNTHPIYKVEFRLHSFLDQSTEIYNDLEYKTVRRYVYDRSHVDTFTPPVLLAKDYEEKIDLSKKPLELLDYYLDQFYNEETKLIQLPTESSIFVDQYVTDTIFKLYSVNDSERLAKISRMPIEENITTIWDALFERSEELFETCETDLHFGIHKVGKSVSARVFSYLGVQYTITNNPTNIANPNIKVNPLTKRKTVETPITNRDDKYIFSHDFYIQNPDVTFSKIETLILQYIRNEIPDRALTHQVLSEYKYWDYQDQYYLIPILVIILKTLIANTYSSI